MQNKYRIIRFFAECLHENGGIKNMELTRTQAMELLKKYTIYAMRSCEKSVEEEMSK